MFYRIHRTSDNKEVIGICDNELLGRTLKEGDLTVTINPYFFEGQQATEEEIIKILQSASNVNLFGERCISIAVDHGFVDRDACITIEGVPHATIITL